jgi:calcineurin-like phosphoesterase family protein
MEYFISDTHFYHYNIIRYCDRPFETVEEMNERMIESWNSVVADNDIVYFLGDFGFGDKEKLSNICAQLNGTKILLRGNHDYKRGKQSWRDIGFKEVFSKKVDFANLDISTFFDGEFDHKIEILSFKNIILSHEPKVVPDDTLNIHGHIHNIPLSTEFNSNNHFCVSVEMINYVPITLEQILQKMGK